MNRAVAERVLKWAPRILGIATAGFFSLFALDAISEGKPAGETATALVTHLIPAALTLAVVGVGWLRAELGGVGFLALAALHVAMSGGRMATSSYLVVDGPLVLIAVLFLAGEVVSRGRGAAPAAA